MVIIINLLCYFYSNINDRILHTQLHVGPKSLKFTVFPYFTSENNDFLENLHLDLHEVDVSISEDLLPKENGCLNYPDSLEVIE